MKNIDGKVLAQKILPHIQATLRMGDSYSPLLQVKKQGFPTDTYHMAEARCPPGTRVMGGGTQISSSQGAPPSGLFDYNAQDVADNNIAALMIIPTQRIDVVAKMKTSGSIMAYATCLSPEVAVSIKP
jgi:hypothetical protein